MTDEIVLYHNPFSRGRIARYMLEEIGEPYRVELLRFDRREHKTEQFLALNPMGKIPTLVHRGVVVTEAAAICAYLADAFPEKGLAPALGDPARGTYFRWLFFGAGCIEPALVDKMFDRPKVEREGALGYGSYDDTVRTLEKALSPGPFLLGDRFSAADVYVGSQIAWAFMTDALEKRSPFTDYAARIRERPAAQRAGQLDKELAESLKT